MVAQKIAKIQDFRGLISAPFTPFDKNGDINPDVIPEYIDYLVKLGVKGVFVNGSTGEGLSLTVAERKVLAERWVLAGKNKLELIIIQIGANSLKDAQELAAHAERIGAAAIASLPPVYYRPDTTAHLVAYMKAIAEAAPKTPLMLYHIPAFVDLKFNLSDFLVEARNAIPTFFGAKYTSVDVRDLQKCHRLPGPPFKLISGYDEVLLQCMDCGVTAAIGATYNFMAPVTLRMIDSYAKGDKKKAMEYQQEVAEALDVISKYGQGISVFKAVMNIMSPIDFGLPRLPLVPVGPKKTEALKKDLERLGSSNWSKR